MLQLHNGFIQVFIEEGDMVGPDLERRYPRSLGQITLIGYVAKLRSVSTSVVMQVLHYFDDFIVSWTH